MASKRWNLSASGVADEPAPAASRSRSPPSERTAWIHGQYAGAPPCSQQRPGATCQPSAAASRVSSCIKRVLPMPGSPLSRNRAPRPAVASASPLRSSWSSASRPTKGRPRARDGVVVPAGFSTIAYE